jgi:hypothetical protein
LIGLAPSALLMTWIHYYYMRSFKLDESEGFLMAKKLTYEELEQQIKGLEQETIV